MDIAGRPRDGHGRLSGKVAVVTGANAGIGRATAVLFAEQGASVVCVDSDGSEADRVDLTIEAAGGRATFLAADVTQRTSCEAMVEAALTHFGRVDVLVNNVGDGVRGRLHEISEADWAHIVDLNLNSVFHGVRAVLPRFLEQRSGNIVNTASTFGILATEEYPAYCATKAAIVNLTRQLAIDYGPDIRVNCVCPGGTASPRLLARIAASPDPEAAMVAIADRNRSLRRLADPMEIAYPILFLASDESSFVTGHALVVDGGQLADA